MRHEALRYFASARQTLRWKTRVGRAYVAAWLHKQYVGRKLYIGITGSAGKTTTKDLVTRILMDEGATAYSRSSLNSPFALAGEVRRIRRNDRFCVMEMGAPKPGALDWPLRLIRPDVAVITVIGRDHYLAYRDVDAIAREKEKLAAALPPHGVAVLNIDDERVRTIGDKLDRRVIWVGESNRATIRLHGATSCWPDSLRLDFEYEGERYQVHTQLHGTHLARPALCALGVALATNVPLERAIEALEKARPSEGRMEIVEASDGVVFIRDDWKAPHWSAHLALEFLRDAKASRKVAVIGTLSDLSGDSAKKYRKFGREILQYCDFAVFVGPQAHRAVGRNDACTGVSTLMAFEEIRDAAEFLRFELRGGDIVLLKGSNRADHLVRLMLHRYEPIDCWQKRCGLDRFCTACDRLYRKSDS